MPPPETLEDRDRKRKAARRQSGLLTVGGAREEGVGAIPRPASPAFGSPIRREAGLALEAEEEDIVNMAARALGTAVSLNGDLALGPLDILSTRKQEKQAEPSLRSMEKKFKHREVDLGVVGGGAESSSSGGTREREPKKPSRKPSRDEDESDVAGASTGVTARKKKLKDVTNSPRSRALDAIGASG
jgi:hypothetical protein